MEIIKYELIKMGKKRLFWCIGFFLLIGNLFTIYTYERYTEEYFYIHEQKKNFIKYMEGDRGADIDGFYQKEMETQSAYIKAYPLFVNGMEERVKQMESTSLFMEPDSYVYRNLEKSGEDFLPFVGLELQVDNCYGVRTLAQYGSGVLFQLVFLFVLTYYMLFWERDMDLMPLLKGNLYGHAPLAAAKLLVMVMMTIGYSLLQECSTILYIGWMYGYGSLERTLQSVSLFRNCTYLCSVQEAIVAVVLIRAIVSILFLLVLYCIGMLLKNEITAIGAAGSILGIEYLFSRFLHINGSLDMLKCVNLFYYWNMQGVLGEYHNLNLFGYPIDRDVVMLGSTLLLLFILSVVGVIAFCVLYQTKTESRIEWIIQKIRGKLSILNHQTSLVYYEFYKLMFQQKKGIVLIILIIWAISETIGVFRAEYYSTAKEASYHSYINKFGGQITDGTIAKIEGEAEFIEQMRQEALELAISNSDEDYVRKSVLNAEIILREEGFDMIVKQLEKLKDKPGNLQDKYLLDEILYQKLWLNTKKDVVLWFVGSAVLFFFISGIYTIDMKKNMLKLIESTYYGRKRLDNSRIICALLCIGMVYLIVEFPLFLQYYKIDRFCMAGQRLEDFTMISISANIYLGMMFIGVFICKALAFLIVGLVCLKLARVMRNEMVVMLTGIGVVGTIAGVLYHFDWDINMLFLGIM